MIYLRYIILIKIENDIKVSYQHDNNLIYLFSFQLKKIR